MICVSVDLDGTLLNSKHEISYENIIALKKLKESGYEVILNTGRAYQDVVKNKILQSLQLPIICLNGSAIYSSTGALLYETIIPIHTSREILNMLDQMKVWTLVYTNDGGFPSTLPPLHHKSYEELKALFSECNYNEIFTKDNLKIYKLIALVRNEELDKIETVKTNLTAISGIAMASSFPNNVEITSNEAQKGKALLRYQELLNLPFEEIFAFGDGGNDISQFEVATTSVAMGNAPLPIQRAANFITKTNDDDGFSYAVRHLLPLLNHKNSISYGL